MEFADWIDMAGNVIENNRDGNIIEGGTHTNIVVHPDNPQITRPPQVKLVAPTAAKPGQPVPVKTGPADRAGRLGQHRPRRQPALLPLGLRRRDDRHRAPRDARLSPRSARTASA